MRARLGGKPLPEFHFRDLGSLVSLGELSAVGNLMGGLIGGSMMVQGLIARWMYVSLYKMHQVSHPRLPPRRARHDRPLSPAAHGTARQAALNRQVAPR